MQVPGCVLISAPALGMPAYVHMDLLQRSTDSNSRPNIPAAIRSQPFVSVAGEGAARPTQLLPSMACCFVLSIEETANGADE